MVVGLVVLGKRARRVARLVELGPAYCDVVCRRYEALVGDVQVLEATGEGYDAAAERRAAEAVASEAEAAE